MQGPLEGVVALVTARSLQPDETTAPVGGSLAETCSAVEAAGGWMCW